MPNRLPLPAELVALPFAVREAVANGISLDRLRWPGLDRPFYGVRSIGVDLAILDNRCLAYAARMAAHAMFSHTTAARLWGMPLPLRFTVEPVLHVTVSGPHRAPRVEGIVGHTRTTPTAPALLRGLAVVSPADAWADLAEVLPLHDLVAAGENAVTGNPVRDQPPITSVAALHEVTKRRRGSPGSRNRDKALGVIEVGPLSRTETLTRLLLVGAGLPHPLINPEVYDDDGTFVAMPDLTWPEYRVALEYEGDGHRTVKRFRADISRIEKLVDHGWLVVKVSATDLFDNQRELVERVVRRLDSRGWTPGRIRLPQNGVYER